MEITRVADEELTRLAEKQGPSGAAANILQRLSRKRAKDRQVFAWQVGHYYFVGPEPDAEMEVRIITFVEGDEDEDEDQV